MLYHTILLYLETIYTGGFFTEILSSSSGFKTNKNYLKNDKKILKRTKSCKNKIINKLKMKPSDIHIIKESIQSQSCDVLNKAMSNLEVNLAITSEYMSSDGKILVIFHL